MKKRALSLLASILLVLLGVTSCDVTPYEPVTIIKIKNVVIPAVSPSTFGEIIRIEGTGFQAGDKIYLTLRGSFLDPVKVIPIEITDSYMRLRLPQDMPLHTKDPNTGWDVELVRGTQTLSLGLMAYSEPE